MRSLILKSNVLLDAGQSKVSHCDLEKKVDRNVQKLKIRCSDWFQDQVPDWTKRETEFPKRSSTVILELFHAFFLIIASSVSLAVTLWS